MIDNKQAKIAILTYHRHDNYGAILQCYALQHVVESLGVDAEILDYECIRDTRPWTITAIKHRGIIPCIKGMLGIVIRCPRADAFRRFRKQLHISQNRYDHKDIWKADAKYDCFIVGSDNVWNPEITGWDQTYFLDFVPDKSKCCSYAASMGVDVIPKESRSRFHNLLRDFRILTLREASAASEIAKLLSRQDVQSVLDPTMLLTAEQWRKLMHIPSASGYILAYQMVPSRRFLKVTHELGKKLGRKIVFVPFPQGGLVKASKSVSNAGPEEWLGLIDNADYVVTDSFHGCVFSIIFEKKFSVVVSQLGSRLISLMTTLGLDSRIVREESAIDIEEIINYDDVRRRLKPLQDKSYEILREIAKPSKPCL